MPTPTKQAQAVQVQRLNPGTPKGDVIVRTGLGNQPPEVAEMTTRP